MPEVKVPQVEALLNEYGQRLVAALDAALPRTADATGELRQSIHFTIRRFGISYRFELLLADYYKWVDEGRKPGKMPPRDAILKWLKDKRFVLREGRLQTKTKGSKLKKVSDDMQLANRIAFLIQRKIGRFGTKPTNFYSSTVPEWVADLKREIPKALKRDVLVEVRSI